MRVRYNMRYRGPMESAKEEAFRRQAHANVQRIKDQFTSLSERIHLHSEKVYAGPRETILEDTVPFRIGHMERDMKIIERGATRG